MGGIDEKGVSSRLDEGPVAFGVDFNFLEDQNVVEGIDNVYADPDDGTLGDVSVDCDVVLHCEIEEHDGSLVRILGRFAVDDERFEFSITIASGHLHEAPQDPESVGIAH